MIGAAMKWEYLLVLNENIKAKINIEQLQNKLMTQKKNYNCFWKITM
jgi:hypothetical protein